jgi:hypothetical protein
MIRRIVRVKLVKGDVKTSRRRDETGKAFRRGRYALGWKNQCPKVFTVLL